MNFNLRLFGGRGGSSGGGGGGGALKAINALLKSGDGKGIVEGDSYNWERNPLSDFKTVLDDLTSGYGGLDEDVYYINYKNLGWVRIDSDSDPTMLRKNMSNIKGAVIDGGWGIGLYGDTKDAYAFKNEDSYNFDFKKSAKYLGSLQDDGTVQRQFSGATLPKEATSSGLKYTSEYHSFVSKGKTYEYNVVNYDVSNTVTKKKR